MEFQRGKLLQLMGERDLTCEKLAEMVGVNHSTISRWRCGENVPNLREAFLLSAALDWPVSDMMRRGGES